MYQTIYTSGLISSLATNSRDLQLSKLSTSFITALMKVSSSPHFCSALRLLLVLKCTSILPVQSFGASSGLNKAPVVIKTPTQVQNPSDV